MPKYVLDANATSSIDLFQRRGRDGASNRRVDREQAETLEEGVFAPFERRHRIFVPSANAFKEAGRILAALTKEHLRRWPGAPLYAAIR